MGETLYPLSTALGLTGLLDYERELLELQGLQGSRKMKFPIRSS
jgi:hypothetical protein